MESFQLEKFILFNKCDLSVTRSLDNNSIDPIIINKYKTNILLTINSVYFFANYEAKREEGLELEKNLILKIPNEEYHLIGIEDKTIKLKYRYENIFLILEEISKDLKEIIVNVFLLLDGYKLVCEKMNLSYTVNLDYIYFLVENMMKNPNSLVIEKEFFKLRTDMLQLLVIFLIKVEKLVVKVPLWDSLFLEDFLEVFDNKQLKEFTPEKTSPPSSKLVLIRVLKISEVFLNDDIYDSLSPLIISAENLIEIDLSKNHLTSLSLKKITECFSSGIWKYLEKINLSNNNIESHSPLDTFVPLLENSRRLNFLNLNSNFLDNFFLKELEEYLKGVYGRLQFSEIIIELRNNRFDTHLEIKKYKFTDSSDEEKVYSNIYNLSNFVKNLQIMKLKLRFKFDAVKHFKEYKDEEGKIESIRVFTRTIEPLEKINFEEEGTTEMEQYVQWIKLFYLIEQYFDPNLNDLNFEVKANKEDKENTQEKRENLEGEVYDCTQLSQEFLNNENRNEKFEILRKRTKELMEKIKNSGRNNSMEKSEFSVNYSYPFANEYEVQNNLLHIWSEAFFSIERDQMIRSLGRNPEEFNPNWNVEDLNIFFHKILQTKIILPYTSVYKFINRFKIESALALKEKDYHTLSYLHDMSKFFETPYMDLIQNEYDNLSQIARIINEGIILILNFEGYSSNNTNFMFEVNNYLDFFLMEAQKINLDNDLIKVARTVQFLRSNMLRGRLYKKFENLLKEENLFSSPNIVSSEFDLLFKKYQNITDFKRLRIPDSVKAKELSLHPSKLDYLKISEFDTASLIEDLKIIIQKLVDEESYGIRNIHDRIHFFLTWTSDPSIDSENKFHLNKMNKYLKVSRYLFRYFNNMDIKSFKEDYMIDFTVNLQLLSDASEKDNNFNGTSSLNNVIADRNAIVYNNKVKSQSDYDKSEGSLSTNFKKQILTFSPEPIRESLIKFKDDLKTQDEIEQFKVLYMKLNEILYEIIDKNFSEDGHTPVSPPRIYKGIKDFLSFYVDVKEQFYNKNRKIYELFNGEIVLQLYRHANRSEFTKEVKIVQYVFGVLSILSLYLDLDSTLFMSTKKWLNYLISKNFYKDYCVNILNNLNNHKQCKILWVPSIYEIECRINNEKMNLSVSYDADLEDEKFEIDEITTISILFEKIMNESKYLKDTSEKRLYWIYLHHLDLNNETAVFNEEYILDVISYVEDNYMNNIDFMNEALKHMPSVGRDSFQSNRLKSSLQLSHELSVSSDFLNPGVFIFRHIKFCLKRRIFSPSVINGQYDYLQASEIKLIYQQIRSNFITGEFSVNVADGDTEELCAYLITLFKKQKPDNFDSTISLESNIEANLHKVMPKFKKNVINNSLDNFVSRVIKIMNDRQLEQKSEISLKMGFLKTLKTYDIFFSSVYKVKTLTSSNFILPENFLVVVNCNYIIFLEATRFEKIVQFKYPDIIYCFFYLEELHLAFCHELPDESFSEYRVCLQTEYSRPIMEDILSYAALYLAIYTKSEKTDCKMTGDPEVLNDYWSVNCNMKNYQFAYQRKIPFMNFVPSLGFEFSKELQGRRVSSSLRHSMFKNSFINRPPMSVIAELNRANSSQNYFSKSKHSTETLGSKKEAEDKVDKLDKNDKPRDGKILNTNASIPNISVIKSSQSLELIPEESPKEENKKSPINFKDDGKNKDLIPKPDQSPLNKNEIKISPDITKSDPSSLQHNDTNQQGKIHIPVKKPNETIFATDPNADVLKTQSYTNTNENINTIEALPSAKNKLNIRASKAISSFPIQALTKKTTMKNDLIDPTRKMK